MQTEFTPLTSLFGGAILGLAAAILMATTGRIAGISGIVSRFIPPVSDRHSVVPALIFVVGLLLAAPLFHLLSGSLPESTMVAGPWVLIVGGLLVGLGAGAGSGCTSGHGVCGLSRLSPRSMVATGVFMLTAAITVYIVRHVL